LWATKIIINGSRYYLQNPGYQPDILEFLKYNLLKENFQVYTANDGLEGIKIAKKELPHLIVLDVMMPELDGVETCHRLRTDPELDDCLITFLTARSEEYSHIAGLEAGADDYFQKPVRPRLLVSKVKALLRRSKKINEKENSSNHILEIGSLHIDRERFQVFKHMDDAEQKTEIELAKKEFEILWLMAQKPGRVFSRNEIFRKIWGLEVIVGNRTIDVHVSKLRDKVGNNIIKTVKGVGYKLEEN